MRTLLTLVFLVTPLTAAADAGARIFYSKSFPGSTPAYVEITVDKNGAGEYKEAPDDDRPMKFKLGREEVAEIFDLADKLDRFTRPLESNLKVANMGMKTFRYLEGDKKSEAKFNYSLEENARLLNDWFERITESETHLINLERTARFDRLGVNKVLLQLEVSWDRKRLVSLDQFLPMLDRVAKNESYLHMARERAAQLADVFRASRPKAE